MREKVKKPCRVKERNDGNELNGKLPFHDLGLAFPSPPPLAFLIIISSFPPGSSLPLPLSPSLLCNCFALLLGYTSHSFVCVCFKAERPYWCCSRHSLLPNLLTLFHQSCTLKPVALFQYNTCDTHSVHCSSNQHHAAQELHAPAGRSDGWLRYCSPARP